MQIQLYIIFNRIFLGLMDAILFMKSDPFIDNRFSSFFFWLIHIIHEARLHFHVRFTYPKSTAPSSVF